MVASSSERIVKLLVEVRPRPPTAATILRTIGEKRQKGRKRAIFENLTF